MSEENNSKRERCQHLVMALIDGEISQSEKMELDNLIDNYSDLQKEYQEFLKLKEVTQTMKLKQPDQEIWQAYWQNIYNRLERGFAWTLFGFGAALLLAYGLYTFIIDIWRKTEIPILLKMGIYIALVGVILLLISIMGEKLFLWRNERYKEVLK